MNVGRLAMDSIDKYGEYDSLFFEDKTFTNIEMNRYAGRMGRVLQSYGVKPGDFVLVMMPNTPEVLAAFQACWKIGAVIIPVTPMLNAREVRYMLEDSEAKVALTLPVLAGRLKDASAGLPNFKHLLVIGETNVEGAENIQPKIESSDPIETLLDRAEDDLALLLYTSGTTGNPKGVMLTHSNMYTNALSVASLQDIPPYFRTMHVLPLSHSFGVLMMDLGYVLGSASALLTHFDTKKVFETIQRFRVDRFSVVPTMLTYMINFPERENYDLTSLTRVNTGGAALQNEIRVQFEKLFNVIVKEGYGLSETSPTLTGYQEHDAYRPGAVGKAIPGVEVCIMDFNNNILGPGQTGEICARGPNIMKGYWKKEDATKEALAGGWFHTGDIGYMDEDGYVFITDRKKDLIIKGGENISPREIEEAIHEHPAVAEAAVLGVPDPVYGENIVAAVVLKPNQTATEEEIKAHVGKHVTKFKIPAQVIFMPMLMKNPTGKIQKRAIKEQILGQMKAMAGSEK